MNMRKSKIYLFFIMITLLGVISAGCGYLPSPDEVIGPPGGKTSNNLNININSFIPNGMTVLTSENSGGRYRIQFADIENDGVDELIAFYGIPTEYECKGFVILKKGENWQRFHDQSYIEGTKYNVESVKFIDLNGGNKEMIIELSDFNEIRIFRIMKFEDAVEKLYTFGEDRLDIIRMEEENPLIAVWINKPDGHDINIIQWEDDGFINATYDAPGYFLQLLPKYSGDEADGSDRKLMYRADILMKAGDYSRALEAIGWYRSFEHTEEDIRKARVIESRCLFYLGETDQALSVLSGNKTIHGYDNELLLESNFLLVDILLQKGNVETAHEILDVSKELLYNFLHSNYKLHVWTHEYEKRLEKLSDVTN